MSDIKKIPEGMSTVTPHLVCKGAADAIEFYKNAFGAVDLGRLSEKKSGKLIHAMISIGDSKVMLVDEFPEWGFYGPTSLNGTPITIHLYVDDVDAVVERAVECGAKITMQVDNMFWGDRYGKIEDPFGHLWSIATHVRDVTPEEMEKAAQDMFKS